MWVGTFCKCAIKLLLRCKIIKCECKYLFNAWSVVWNCVIKEGVWQGTWWTTDRLDRFAALNQMLFESRANSNRVSRLLNKWNAHAYTESAVRVSPVLETKRPTNIFR